MEALSFIKEIFLSDAGSFASVLAFLGLCFWVVVKVTTINNNHSTLMNTFNKHDTFIDDLRTDIAYIKGNIDLLNKRESDIAQAHSPISLTDKGNEYAERLNIDVLIENNWLTIISDLEANVQDKNPYDIQEYCRKIAAVQPEKFFDEASILQIKQEAYKLGRSFFDLSIIPAIKIRDRYLREKGINIEEIDKHDPNKQHV